MKPLINKTFLVLLISIPGVAQIGAKVQQQSKIYGLWQNSQFGYQMTLMLNPDGSGEFDGEMIKFTTQANKLSIVQAGVTTIYTYTLSGNSLSLSGGDLEGTIAFSRKGSMQSPVITQVPAQDNANPTNGNIVGVWSGNGETIEFKLDGQCTYLGNIFPYEVSQGQITLTTVQGKVIFGYSVKENQLTLSVNGQQVVYVRGSNTSKGNAQNNSGVGNVPQELVGKWCYMNNNQNSSTNRCITLNADGTYIYNSESSRSVSTPDLYGGTSSQGADSGTWYVQGDRIYYNSQTQGQGSYRLEKRNHPKNVGDPMIVLDGEAYVTATLRAPWR
jgi:hypothetical protein